MKSSHTQVCTCTLPSASFGSASGLPSAPPPWDWWWASTPALCSHPWPTAHASVAEGPCPPQMLKWWSFLSPEPRAWTHRRSSSGDTYASAFWPFHCIRPFLLTQCPCNDSGSHYQLWSVLSESTAYPPHSLLALGNFASVLDWKKAINNPVIKIVQK